MLDSVHENLIIAYEKLDFTDEGEWYKFHNCPYSLWPEETEL